MTLGAYLKQKHSEVDFFTGKYGEGLDDIYNRKVRGIKAFDPADYSTNLLTDDFDISDWDVAIANSDVSISDGVITKTGSTSGSFRADYVLPSTIPSGSRVRILYRQEGDADWALNLMGASADGFDRMTIGRDLWFANDIVVDEDKTELRVSVTNDDGAGSLRNVVLRVEDIESIDYDIVVRIGQSNEQGKSSGTPTNPDIDLPHPDIDVYQGTFDGQLGQERGRITQAVMPVSHYIVNRDGVSPCLEFARYYADNTLAAGRKVMLVPFARGATQLVNANASWDPDVLSENRTYGMLDDVVDAVRALLGLDGSPALVGSGSTVTVIGWCQGESDTSVADAALYNMRFTALLTYLRTQFNDSNIPCVIMGLMEETGLYDNVIAEHKKLDKDSGEMVALANVIYSGYKDTYPSGNVGDDTHFNTAANRLRGYDTGFDHKDRIVDGN